MLGGDNSQPSPSAEPKQFQWTSMFSSHTAQDTLPVCLLYRTISVLLKHEAEQDGFLFILSITALLFCMFTYHVLSWWRKFYSSLISSAFQCAVYFLVPGCICLKSQENMYRILRESLTATSGEH